LQIRRRWKVRAPRGYLEHAATERRIGGDDVVPTEQLPFEFMLNALRLNAGFTLTQFSATTGLDPGTIRPRLEPLHRARLADTRMATGYAQPSSAGVFSTT
jgi:oxygen-independent coproporphyrinogen-3 oxidase